MVVVQKPNGKVRVCVDLTKLNESVIRERHLMPADDQTLAQFSEAKVFSKIDANSGYYQIPLAEESRLLTSFITPFGVFSRLPLGISSGPEYYQRRMGQVLCGLEGTVCQMDDVVIFGKDDDEHDQRLLETLGRVEDAGITLNEGK